MKSLFLGAMLSLLLPMTASAFSDRGEFELGDLRDDMIIDNYTERKYKMVDEVCEITKVRFHVTGDNIEILDADILFANGRTQDIDVRRRFKRNSSTVWKDLKGKKRCIVGFSVRARPDLDFDNARITLYGIQKWGKHGHEVRIGTVRIRDFDRF